MLQFKMMMSVCVSASYRPIGRCQSFEKILSPSSELIWGQRRLPDYGGRQVPFKCQQSSASLHDETIQKIAIFP